MNLLSELVVMAPFLAVVFGLRWTTIILVFIGAYISEALAVLPFGIESAVIVVSVIASYGIARNIITRKIVSVVITLVCGILIYSFLRSVSFVVFGFPIPEALARMFSEITFYILFAVPAYFMLVAVGYSVNLIRYAFMEKKEIIIR